jgi:hypothetical protein
VTGHDDLANSDDLVREARADALRPEAPSDEPADASTAQGENPGAATNRKPRLVLGDALLTPSGSTVARLDQGSPYTLEVDGERIGRLTTDKQDDTLRQDANRGFLLRRTRVRFDDDDAMWRIAAVVPTAEEVADQIRGKRFIEDKTLTLRLLNRRVVAFEELAAAGGAEQQSRRIAATEGSFGGMGKKADVAVVAGTRRCPLSPARERRRGDLGADAQIRRRNPLHHGLWESAWAVETKNSVPLVAVLLYWHILMGDVFRLGGGGVAG